MAVDERELTSGLDALEIPLVPRVSRSRKAWRVVWPKLLAIAIVLGVWQLVHTQHLLRRPELVQRLTSADVAFVDLRARRRLDAVQVQAKLAPRPRFAFDETGRAREHLDGLHRLVRDGTLQISDEGVHF